MMPSERPGANRWLLPGTALLICAVQIAVTLPGELNADSTDQLRQAMVHQFGDWHPPVMAVVWSWLIELTGKPGSLLFLQQGLHWLGFGLLADGCRRAHLPKRAWAVLACGAFPLFLFYDKVLVKDVEMGAAYVAAVGVSCWYLLARRPIPIWALLVAVVLLAYGTLTRTNAVFALGPLLCLLFAAGRSFGFTKIVAFSAPVAVAALLLSGVINHRVIGAAPQDALQSLQLYDLTGIAVRSGDQQVLGPHAPQLAAVTRCYTAYWWDPLSPWGSCADLRKDFDYLANMRPVSSELLAERATLWRRAIIEHPLAYAAHRLAFYNSSIYFAVPALHFRFSMPAEGHPITQRDIRMDYIKRSFIFWPVFWLAVGGCGLMFLTPRQGGVVPATARLLITSGLLYAGAYLLVGVATDVRYYYWPVMAVLTGIVLAIPELRAGLRERPALAKTAAAIIIGVIVLGYGARIANLQFT